MFSDQYFFPFCRGGFSSSSFHPLEHRNPRFSSALWLILVSPAALTLMMPYHQIQPHDPLPQAILHSLWLPARCHWLSAPSVLLYPGVSAMVFSCLLSDAQISQPLELVREDRETPYPKPTREQKRSVLLLHILACFHSPLPDSIVHVQNACFDTRWQRRAPFPGTYSDPWRTDTRVVAIMSARNLTGKKKNLKPIALTYIFPAVSHSFLTLFVPSF